MIERKVNGSIILDHHPELSDYDKSVIHYAAMSFGFLLNTEKLRGRAITLAEFADMITYYVKPSHRANEICRILRLAE